MFSGYMSEGIYPVNICPGYLSRGICPGVYVRGYMSWNRYLCVLVFW